MEPLELPILEDTEETPPVIFSELEIDLTAFRLWREASRPDAAETEEPS